MKCNKKNLQPQPSDVTIQYEHMFGFCKGGVVVEN